MYLVQALFYWDNKGDVEVYAIIPYPKLVNITLCLSNMTLSWFLDDYLGLNILWVFNNFSGWIIDSDFYKSLYDSIYLLDGLY